MNVWSMEKTGFVSATITGVKYCTHSSSEYDAKFNMVDRIEDVEKAKRGMGLILLY